MPPTLSRSVSNTPIDRSVVLTWNDSSWRGFGHQSSGTVCRCYPYCPAGQAASHPHCPRGRDINFRSDDSHSPHRRRRDRYVTVGHRVHLTHLFSRRKIQATGRGKTFIRRLESQPCLRRLDSVWNLVRYGRAHSPRNVRFRLSTVTLILMADCISLTSPADIVGGKREQAAPHGRDCAYFLRGRWHSRCVRLLFGHQQIWEQLQLFLDAWCVPHPPSP